VYRLGDPDNKDKPQPLAVKYKVCVWCVCVCVCVLPLTHSTHSHPPPLLQIQPCFGNFTDEEKRHYEKHKSDFPLFFLQKNIHSRLKSSGVCLEFLMQPQENACKQHVDDATSEWTSNYFKVAEILIPPQNPSSVPQQDFCRRQSFNPWIGTTEHQPLGKVNHFRKIAYLSASVVRRRARAESEVRILRSQERADKQALTHHTPLLPPAEMRIAH
jgi:hypothetical protein